MLKRLLSFFIPVNIHKRESVISKSLEVTWNNGKLVLDSKNTNYSFGSLQRILRIGLNHIGFDNLRKMNHILILGVAGGSVIRTLTHEIAYKGKITGVDIDAEVIAVANEYFGLSTIPGVEIVIDDAFEFVLKTKGKYDLVVIDIFSDISMPNFLFESFFVNHISQILVPGGHILFNTMILSAADEKRNQQYIADIDRSRLQVRTIPRLEKHNELIVMTKKDA
ncbi:MAG: fused MFS/spermidine synthase [Flavobacterium sp.]|nr:fused MFS/spermidine synthase [Flavobacterium sp.]